MYKWNKEKDQTLKGLVREGKSMLSISRFLGANKNTVRRRMTRFKLETRGTTAIRTWINFKKNNEYTKHKIIIKKKFIPSAIRSYKKLKEFYKDNPSIEIKMCPITYEITSNIKIGSHSLMVKQLSYKQQGTR